VQGVTNNSGETATNNSKISATNNSKLTPDAKHPKIKRL